MRPEPRRSQMTAEQARRLQQLQHQMVRLPAVVKV
jgi:hypothetical protein